MKTSAAAHRRGNKERTTVMENPDTTVTHLSADKHNGANVGKTCPITQERLLEDILKRKLMYHFMTPFEKFQACGRKPWKLCIQVLKTALVTIQLVLFGLNNEMLVDFREENTLTFKHLFLKDYKHGRRGEGNTLFPQEDVYNHINFTIHQYLELRKISVGNFAYGEMSGGQRGMTVCRKFYKHGNIFPGNETFHIDPNIETECFTVLPMTPISDLSLEDKFRNKTLDFYRLVSVEIKFKLKSINLQTIRHHELPDCYDFTVTITFNNKAYSGGIKLKLDNDVTIKKCRDWFVSGSKQQYSNYRMFLDAVIILTCITSTTLSIWAAIRGFHLQREYVSYVRHRFSKPVPWSDKIQFVNGWHFLSVAGDVLSIVGSILKMEIQAKILTSYDVCSIFLGTSTLLIWVGVIRYLGFFKKYNILILTLRAALPNVIRFCCCAVTIFLGYCFCGWIVLGPYFAKFRSLSEAFECLFCLVNGDDMFTTFLVMQQKSHLVWLFSRVYLYSFISLFIYMVLSLFIALITDTFATVKRYQREGFPQSELHTFLTQCKDFLAAEASQDEGVKNHSQQN
ncbi:mucolipin-3-like isoform X2 [Engystomops pustulosus]|uniref:mucolipin-3-like isoform X2 n=1 Tax=Engystomops pustulosus TaxID=76066 RepID=UPI003AFA2B9F